MMEQAGRALLVLVVASCATPTRENSSPHTNATIEPAPTQAVERDYDPRSNAFVRSCQTAVAGGLAADWRERAATSGPLALLDFGSFTSAGSATGADPDAVDREYRGQKVLAVVEAGAVVTLAVPKSRQDRLALLYDPANWRRDARYEISDGQTAVTFEACPRSPTQFNGGIVIEGRRCAILDVWAEDAVEPERIVMVFGAGDCGE